MKKKFLLISCMAVLLVCLFVISVSAEDTVPETYEQSDTAYTVYTEAQFTEVFNGIMSGTVANKTIVLGCDITTNTDLIMDSECDITVDLNNHTYNNQRKVGDKLGDFDLRNENAVIRVKNGKITSNFCVFIFRTAGQVYCENVDIVSQEETFYNYGGYTGVISLKNCNFDVTDSGYSVTPCSNCNGKGGMLYQIDGGTYDGLGIACAKEGSYVRNCKVHSRDLKVDSWHTHGASNSDVTVEIRNVIIETMVTLNDPRVDPVLYDCVFTKVDLTGGNQLLVSYTSATCDKAGTKTSYQGVDTGTLDEQYSIDNPALGHKVDVKNATDVIYENYLKNGRYVSKCLNCALDSLTEETGTALPLFACIGYSAPENGNGGITVGYTVNNEAITEYKTVTGKTLKYGVFAVSKNKLKDNDIFTNGEASDGVIAAEIKTDHVAFELKIKGFETEKQKTSKLAMGAYVEVTKDETTSYSYMQYAEASEGEKYHFITFNEAVELANESQQR